LFLIRGDLVTLPVTYDVEDREPTALARLRAVDEALRDQREDRHRADVLLSPVDSRGQRQRPLTGRRRISGMERRQESRA
jgi:hypothetical protein